MAGNPLNSTASFLVPGCRVSARAKGSSSEANISSIVKQALSVTILYSTVPGNGKAKSRLMVDSSKIEGEVKLGATVKSYKEKDNVKTPVIGEIVKLEDKSTYSVVFTNKQVFEVPRSHIIVLGDLPKDESRRGPAVATEHLVKKMKMELLHLGVEMDFFTPEQREIALAYMNQPEKKRRRPSSPGRGARDQPASHPDDGPRINRAVALVALADAQMCPAAAIESVGPLPSVPLPCALPLPEAPHPLFPHGLLFTPRPVSVLAPGEPLAFASAAELSGAVAAALVACPEAAAVLASHASLDFSPALEPGLHPSSAPMAESVLSRGVSTSMPLTAGALALLSPTPASTPETSLSFTPIAGQPGLSHTLAPALPRARMDSADDAACGACVSSSSFDKSMLSSSHLLSFAVRSDMHRVSSPPPTLPPARRSSVACAGGAE